jgi:signal transduction histidine kinase
MVISPPVPVSANKMTAVEYLNLFESPVGVVLPRDTFISDSMLAYLNYNHDQAATLFRDYTLKYTRTGSVQFQVKTSDGTIHEPVLRVERVGTAYIFLADSSEQRTDLQARFRSILEIAQQITTSLNPEEIIPRLAIKAQQLVLADSCTVFLLSENGKSLIPIFTNDTTNAEAVMSFQLLVGQGLTGHVAQTGQAMIVDDSRQSTLVAHVPGTRDVTTSLISVPLLHQQEVIGVISLDRVGRDPFSKQDLELLTILGAQAAGIVAHANLFEQVRKSEQLYRGLFDNALHGIFRINLKGEFLQANSAFLNIMGHDNLSSFRNWSEDAPWENSAVRSDFIDLVCSRGEITDFKCTGYNNSNELLHLKYNGRFLPAGSYIEGSVEDITREMQLEDENRNRILFLERLISQNPQPMLVFDRDGQLQQTNPAIAELFGRERTRCLETFHPWLLESIPEISQITVEMQRGNKVPRREVSLTLDREMIALHLLGFPVLNQRQETTHLIVTLENVTVEHSLREQLYQSQKMEELGTLTSGIVHDFNNILSAIMGYGSLLKSHTHEPEKVAQYAETIEATSLRASRLARTLLGFARSSSLDSVAGTLEDAIHTSLQLVRHITKKEIEIDVEVDERASQFPIDSGRIEQVILNLLINAVDALNEQENPSISVRAICDNNSVLLKIMDNGSGIPVAIQSRIFDPFFTTKPMGKGTGLGLSTVKSILEDLGGHIVVTSEPDEGTVFTITLASSLENRINLQKPEQSLTELPHGDETILLIDDESVVLEVLGNMLMQLGYTVLKATTALEGFDIFQKKGNAVDLIILDMLMPDMSGQDLLNEMFQKGYRPPVLICSGHHQVRQEELKHFDIRGQLDKPFTIVELAGAVRAALEI